MSAFGVASLLAVLVAVALLSGALAEGWRRIALRRGVLDLPGARSSHAVPTPRGAGVGPMLALLAGLWIVLPPGDLRAAALLSIGLAAALGLVDDLRPLAPGIKLLGQGLACLPLALTLPWPGALGPSEWADGGGAATLLALAFGVLMLNAWNFMDGINGIATLAAIALSAATLAGSALAGLPPDGIALPALLLAACVGFLPLNFPKARVFLGDCGSHGLGMAIAAIVLWPRAAPTSAGDADGLASGGIAAVALAAATPFLVDVLGTLAHRALDGERLTAAHRRHLYQRAVRSGYSHARVAAGYAAWVLASGGAAMAIQASGGSGATSLWSVAVANGLAWAVLYRRAASTTNREGSP